MDCVAAIVLCVKRVLFLLLNLIHVGTFCTYFQAFLFIVKPKGVLPCGKPALKSKFQKKL